MHQKGRESINGFIEAEVQDYGHAVKILQSSLDEAVRQCSTKCLKLVEWAETRFKEAQAKSERLKDKGATMTYVNSDFTIIEAVKGTGYKKGTIEKALKEARDYGYIEYAPGNTPGTEFEYRFATLPENLTCKLLSVEELAVKINGRLTQ